LTTAGHGDRAFEHESGGPHRTDLHRPLRASNRRDGERGQDLKFDLLTVWMELDQQCAVVEANRCRELLPGLIDRSITCAVGWTHRELLATLQYLFGGVAFAGEFVRTIRSPRTARRFDPVSSDETAVSDHVCNQNRGDLPGVARLLAFRSPALLGSASIVFRI
jgi:hypothetical protein